METTLVRKRVLFLCALAVALAALLVAMVRRDALVETASHLDFDVFREAATPKAGLPSETVPSAIALLTEAGFDGRELATDLLLAGVSPLSFALPNYSPFELSDDQKTERQCLAQAIYYEARNQPVLGRIAVADVVLNRVADRRFPSTICRVVYQGQGKSYGCQFSFACDGSLNRPHEPRAWDRAEKLADLIYRGFRPALTGYATYYHADYMTPRWAAAFERSAAIGDHLFYRPPGTLRLAANRLGVRLEGEDAS